MRKEEPAPALARAAADALLLLALSRPQDALAEARSVLAGHPDPGTASVARQTAGIVLRDRGQLAAALAELRAALRLARSSGSARREADVRATIGAALVMSGRTSRGLTELQRAAVGAKDDGELLAKVRLRMGHVLHVLGRHHEALPYLTQAGAAFRHHDDGPWEARALNNRCLVYLALGRTTRADADAARADALFRTSGQELEAAHALHNRALAAHQRGDLPSALQRLSAARERYEALAAPSYGLLVAIDEAAVRLTAGLVSDAIAGLTEALATADVQPITRAELLLSTAVATLASGKGADPEHAIRLAREAAAEFRRQRRQWWRTRAAFVIVQARYVGGERTQQLLRAASALASALAAEHPDEAPLAHLLAGRLAAERHAELLAATHLAAAARARRSGSGLVRAIGWFAEALRREAAGQRGGILRACRRGLDELDEHRLTLGDPELRALATGHGRELSSLALHEALRRGPRQLFRWSERGRATELAVPPARQPAEPQLAGDLASLRDVARRLDAAHADSVPAGHLERERRQREAALRRRRNALAGAGSTAPRLDLDALLQSLDDVTLIELLVVDDTLHVLLAADGRISHTVAGPAAAAQREVRFAQFELRRAAHGRVRDLRPIGRQLQAAILGPAAARLRPGPVVVIPPGWLQAAPWALLPVLHGRPTALAPSAAQWLRARTTRPPVERRVALIAGPDVPGGGREVLAIRDRHPNATLLCGESATAGHVLAALDGAWLGHIAAHGVFRADSPLFSSIRLHDGPLMVHDLERLDRAPYRLVLSACDSGRGTPVGTDELLGMVNGLLSLGTAGVVASVTPVNDEAAVPLMLALHEALGAGSGVASALLAARTTVAGDPIAAATGASFVAVGV